MKLIKSFMFAAAILSCQTASAEQRPIDGYDVVADVVVVRPLSFITTLAGSAVFMAALPLTAIANIPKPNKAVELAADVLVIKPATFTFARPAGDFGHSSTDEGEVFSHTVE